MISIQTAIPNGSISKLKVISKRRQTSNSAFLIYISQSHFISMECAFSRLMLQNQWRKQEPPNQLRIHRKLNHKPTKRTNSLSGKDRARIFHTYKINIPMNLAIMGYIKFHLLMSSARVNNIYTLRIPYHILIACYRSIWANRRSKDKLYVIAWQEIRLNTCTLQIQLSLLHKVWMNNSRNLKSKLQR